MKNSQLTAAIVLSAILGGAGGSIITQQLAPASAGQASAVNSNPTFDSIRVKSITVDQIISKSKDGKITFTLNGGHVQTTGNINANVIKSRSTQSDFIAADDLRALNTSTNKIVIASNPFGAFDKHLIYAELGYQPGEGGVFYMRNKDAILTRGHGDSGNGFIWHLGFNKQKPALYAKHFVKGKDKGTYVVKANIVTDPIQDQENAAPKADQPAVLIDRD